MLRFYLQSIYQSLATRTVATTRKAKIVPPGCCWTSYSISLIHKNKNLSTLLKLTLEKCTKQIQLQTRLFVTTRSHNSLALPSAGYPLLSPVLHCIRVSSAFIRCNL